MERGIINKKKFFFNNYLFRYSLFFILIRSVYPKVEIDSLDYDFHFNKAIEQFEKSRYNFAADYFQEILIQKRNYEDPVTHLLLAKSQYRSGELDIAKSTCRSFLKLYDNSPYQSHGEILLADIFLTEGMFTNAFKNYINIRKILDDSVTISLVDKRIISCISNKINPMQLEGMLFTEENKENEIIINLARCYISWIGGNEQDLKMTLDQIDYQFVPKPFLSLYQSLVKASEKKLRNQTTIALILPTSGLGSSSSFSYISGLLDYLLYNQKDNFVRFELYNTEGNDIKAFKIFKNVSTKKHISAILGPFDDDQILIGSGLVPGIPILLPKSELIGLAEESSNLYFLSPSAKTIAKRTVQLLIEEMNLSKIAILSPGYGISLKMSKYFIEELNNKGIDPVIVEWYYNKPVDLSRHFKSIRKKAWSLIPKKDINQGIAGMEIDSLEGLFDVDVNDFFNLSDEDNTKKMSKKDSAKVILETIDALLIPIEKNELTYVGTQLPMYNLSTLIVGNENWLDMDILNQNVIGPHVQGMRIITDLSRTIYLNNKKEHNYYYSLAYDHFGLINLLASNSNGTRRSFLKQINSLHSYTGESIGIKFGGKNKNENYSTQILEYENKKMNFIGIHNGDSLQTIMP